MAGADRFLDTGRKIANQRAIEMIDLVISGGQTGVDQAGWRAAKACGIRTGGWMPKRMENRRWT